MTLPALQDYSTQALMICAAAREIGDADTVFVGMRLPIVAFGVALATHAPNAVGIFECGIVRTSPAPGMLYTMGDPPNQAGAAWTTGLVQVMGQLQKGRVDTGFIGAAEVDRFGNINTSYAPAEAETDDDTGAGAVEGARVKLPGSGGGADIAVMARRLVVVLRHERRRLVDRVAFVTSPGYLDGGDARQRAGLGGGPAAVITDLCVLRPYGAERELRVAQLHPGVTMEDVRARTGWPVAAQPDCRETPPPTGPELTALASVDRDGFWS